MSDRLPVCPSCDDLGKDDAKWCQSCGTRLFPTVGELELLDKLLLRRVTSAIVVTATTGTFHESPQLRPGAGRLSVAEQPPTSLLDALAPDKEKVT